MKKLLAVLMLAVTTGTYAESPEMVRTKLKSKWCEDAIPGDTDARLALVYMTLCENCFDRYWPKMAKQREDCRKVQNERDCVATSLGWMKQTVWGCMDDSWSALAKGR